MPVRAANSDGVIPYLVAMSFCAILCREARLLGVAPPFSLGESSPLVPTAALAAFEFADGSLWRGRIKKSQLPRLDAEWQGSDAHVTHR
eukprot:scaffold100712_cov31-Tisochrysis_lutea.AAC.2